MALKLLSSPFPRPRWWSSSCCAAVEGNYRHFNRWVERKGRRNYAVVRASSLEEVISYPAASAGLAPHLNQLQPSSPPIFLLADRLDFEYSQASYYTSLGLFIISVPGLWSLIKRSVKSKIVQRTFTIKHGEGNNLVRPNQMAAEILSYFTRNNFVVLDRGVTITGVYYWTRASRKEQIKVKIMLADDGSVSDIIVQGDDQQVDQMRRELQLSEKGMIYVKSIFER